ncbi:TIGR03620 family F420-dependent LLM class oxidoreductase [Mycobacterium sp. 236(2023)]|uniref:TIGR03620 family F420-dependent LLM class oxidoreductase n=1 Tax=Mycobacterium sp. 236(2023) TaxID=3038163 RepID=UPI0024155BF6|nr:TIGR03620 family F420-dependent LLM class oxidoreductase [Mycobacterium sp. 236(2023)]MDG4668376.1 TIGR03620 family F420-dependent LLM class oxidoreductase [Mycobacterium sp. 236(2023)]
MVGHPLGRYGFSIDVRDDDSHLATALTIEGLGFGTLWINGGKLDRLSRLTDLLGATTTCAVGSSIISPDVFGSAEVSRMFLRAEATTPGRLVVGLGSSHRGQALTHLGGYLDGLETVPRDRRLLAALGPRALHAASERFAGAMPMLFTPAQTAAARQTLGADRTLSVGLYVVLDEDAAQARSIARRPLSFLTTMAGYRKSLIRQGFSGADIDSLSDHLVDSLVAWGTPRTIVDHAERLHAAGADHVHLTVLGEGRQPTGTAAARLLAAEFG